MRRELDLSVLEELKRYLFTGEGGDLWCKGCIIGLRKREPEQLRRKPGRSVFWHFEREPIFRTPITFIIRSDEQHYTANDTQPNE